MSLLTDFNHLKVCSCFDGMRFSILFGSTFCLHLIYNIYVVSVIPCDS